MPQRIARFIDDEFEAARAMFETNPVAITPEAKHDADAFFRGTVLRLDAASR